jgi:hypothetical protein
MQFIMNLTQLHSLGYDTNEDLAQSTSFQNISLSAGSDADQNNVGLLQLFNPSSTTYVKHFINVYNGVSATDFSCLMRF